jgi:uncharacterized protein YndB with AHSA1/START domain
MANPLKLLKLKPQGFQFIQEIPIDAPPAAVWKALLEMGTWFRFDDVPDFPKLEIEPHIGGKVTASNRDGSIQMFSGIVGHIEREKLLRINGPMSMTHLPVANAMIWELVPRKDGRATNLRFCQRTFGYITSDLKKNFQGGWKQLWPRLRELAERSAGASRDGSTARGAKHSSRRRVAI